MRQPVIDNFAPPPYHRWHLRTRNARRQNARVLATSRFRSTSQKDEALLMPPTTVEPKVSLEPQHRDWLQKMAPALQIKLGVSAPQAGGAAADADLLAKYKELKAAVAPKVKEAVAADP